MDKLTAMKVFVRVAKSGSFVGGARDFGISRAMATKHIMNLEGSLGIRLFNRTTRSLNLTEVGGAYLERCQQVLSDVEEMEAAVTQLQTEPRGVLKISAPPFIGSSHIAPALAKFLDRHQDLNVELILQGQTRDLIDEGIDIAVFLGALEDTSLIARKLALSPMVVCGAPAYFDKQGIPKVPKDLLEHSCLVNWAIPPRDHWQFNSPKENIALNVSGRMHANVADPIRVAAINGSGIIMLPNYIVGADIEAGRLQVILQDYPLSPLEIHAVYPHRKYLSAKVRQFLDFLQIWLQNSIGMGA
jgi:DNA-binding transcriptional LysR family regulator